MTYSFSSRWLSASALLLAACNGAESLGEYDTEDGSGTSPTGGPGDDGSDGPSASDSASVSASGSTAANTDDGGTASDSDASASGDTAVATDTGDATDTGTPGACEGEGNCVLYPIDCDVVQCGGISMFDDDGCVRTACTQDPTACGEGEPCYRPDDFGGCQSSAVGCVDDESSMTCQCATLPDCGGAFCLPAAEWPAPDAGPSTNAIVQDSCAPNDAPAFELLLGLDGPGCDGVPGAPFVAIRLDGIDPVPGTYAFGDFVGGQGTYDAGGGALHTNANGWVVIDAWGADTVSGTYHLVVPDVVYLSAAFDADFCDTGTICG
jgi:hypothetical protein